MGKRQWGKLSGTSEKSATCGKSRRGERSGKCWKGGRLITNVS